MSYGIVRVQKFTAGSVKGIEIHDRRVKDGISHTNKDIDWERTAQNYDLHPAENCNYRQAVKERIDSLNLNRAVRKDAVVMAQLLVTSDHEYFENMTPDRQHQFFENCYSWAKLRFGEENVISATVHMDERTPHLHVNFVPVTEDGRLCAKEVLSKKNIIQMHDNFSYCIGQHYGLRRGETRAEKQKHLDTAAYKASKAAELAKRVEALEKQKNGLEGKIEGLTRKADAELERKDNYARQIDGMRSEAAAVRTEVESLSEQKQLLLDDIAALNPSRIIDYQKYGTDNGLPEGKESLNGKNVTFSKEDASLLIRSVIESREHRESWKRMDMRVSSWENKVKEKDKTIKSLLNGGELGRVCQENKELKKKISTLESDRWQTADRHSNEVRGLHHDRRQLAAYKAVLEEVRKTNPGFVSSLEKAVRQQLNPQKDRDFGMDR